MAKNKTRLDMLLVNRGLFASREQARAAVLAGEVLVCEQKITKAGTAVADDAEIRLLGRKLPYVSRGGLKLEKAAAVFQLDFSGKTIIDIGSSTGGFVDFSLQKGAAKVYAVDVGTNQLAWKLRQDPRVVVMEKTNARTLSKEQIPELADMLTADVSFISLTLALPAAIQYLLKPEGEVVALIKPQFEAGREAVGKGGIVRDQAVHQQVIEKVCSAFSKLDLVICGLDFSPITGADGNIEYLLYARKGGQASLPDIAAVVAAAWQAHSKLS